MSLVKYLVPALLAGAFLSSPASALPASSASKNLTSAVDPAVIQVKQHNRNDRKVVRKKVIVHKRVVYRPGTVYRTAPVGWRRVGVRPAYWQTAGCVLVGPVWYCP